MDGWYILGTGNFALEVLEWSLDSGLSERKFLGFLGEPDGVAVAATGHPCSDEAQVELTEATPIVNAISSPELKAKVCAPLLDRGAIFQTVIHPSSTVKASRIGAGTLVCPMCVIGPLVTLGQLVTLNYHTGVGHESSLGEFTSTAPGVQIGGNSQVGRVCYFGMNACVIDRVNIGNEAMVSAGAVVIGRVRDGQRVAGNPARRSKLF